MKSRQALTLLLAVAAGILLLAILAHSTRGGEPMLADPQIEKLVEGAPQTLRVSVEGLAGEGSRIPREYTCDGADRPPAVTVSGVPGGAKAVALIMYDPDAPLGTFIHWLAVAPAQPSVVFPSPQAVEGRNDFHRIGYGGPCPPRGHGPHRYYFLAVALDTLPRLEQGYSLQQLLEAARGHVVAWGYTMGTYERR